jgi:hypothetical protein
VITNTNTGRKCSMIEHIMQSMQFPAELIEKVCGDQFNPCTRRIRQWQSISVRAACATE